MDQEQANAVAYAQDRCYVCTQPDDSTFLPEMTLWLRPRKYDVVSKSCICHSMHI